MSDDTASKKIEELKRKTRENFSEEEINKFITMGKQLASKSVLSMLISVIEEGPAKGLDARECEKLVKKIKAKMPYNYCGFVQCSFDETPFLLNISLSLVDAAYKTEVDIPDVRYTADLYQKYNFLKNTAVAYWRQFAEDNKELYDRICNYRADVDFGQLIIDTKNPTSMYFDPCSAKRIGIFCYYVDQNGTPFYKRKI